MEAEFVEILQKATVSPAREIGAFEALWMTEVSSFKQLHGKLSSSRQELLSFLVDEDLATKYFQEALCCLKTVGINDFHVKVRDTVGYPSGLYDAEYPLNLLYYRGRWDLVSSPGIAVIGTRHPSEDGIKRAKRLVKELVAAKYTIYSGLAAGIDTVAHETAIQHGGLTIAVIGTPLSHCYPAHNKGLQEEIAKNYLLVSQVPILAYDKMAVNFRRSFFPERNKTMAALSNATVIVEAGENSGTLIQARAALKQGRKVFILNNNFQNSSLSWTYKLEKMGAIRVTNTAEILQDLSYDMNTLRTIGNLL